MLTKFKDWYMSVITAGNRIKEVKTYRGDVTKKGYTPTVWQSLKAALLIAFSACLALVSAIGFVALVVVVLGAYSVILIPIGFVSVMAFCFLRSED